MFQEHPPNHTTTNHPHSYPRREPPVILFEILLIGYTAIGCAYWAWMAYGAYRINRTLPVLIEEKIPNPESWPALSVIVPACNEGDTLEAAANTLLEQDYPNLELILIDDRSDDDTGRVVDRIAARDDRVRPLHIKQLPHRWLGKVHALDRGVSAASGEWLLMTDADVHYTRPDSLRRFIAYAEKERVDHLAAAPEMWPCGLLVDTAISSFLRAGLAAGQIWKVSDPDSQVFAGVGAFNLVRKSAFDTTEGFEWLRLEVVDDLGLGMMIKQSGGRSHVVNGTGLLGLDWYRSFEEMALGAEKAFASVAGCSFWRMLGIVAVSTALELSPWVALAPWPIKGVRLAGLAMVLLWIISVVLSHRWARRPLIPGFLSPLIVPLGDWILIRTAWLGLRRGGVLWRGTLYPSEMLREGDRVKLGR
jgi:hypothetical protein